MATRNLGQVSAIHIGTVEPQNKDLIWRDASQNPRLWKVWNSVTSVWEVVPSQAVANNFLNLGDTPVSYTGSGGKILKVKANLSGIEFVDETTYSSEIDAAIDKAVLSDSDEFLLSDAGTVKKTKWSQIKSSLKSYFDTLYVSVSTVTSQLIQNWNEAFSWGDHSLEGYLTNEGESFSCTMKGWPPSPVKRKPLKMQRAPPRKEAPACLLLNRYQAKSRHTLPVPACTMPSLFAAALLRSMMRPP